jgi:GntR family transcriptional regulator
VIELLASRGAKVVSSAATIAATKLPETARTTLSGLSDEPWLCITETCVTDDGRVVLHATDFHRGDIFAFHVVRQRSEGPPSSTPTTRRRR